MLIPLTKLFPLFSTRFQRWWLPIDLGFEVVVVTEEEEEERVEQGGPHQTLLNGEAQNIQTFPKETKNGALYIIGGGNLHIFVLSRLPVHGRMFSPPNHQDNEPVTNSARNL